MEEKVSSPRPVEEKVSSPRPVEEKVSSPRPVEDKPILVESSNIKAVDINDKKENGKDKAVKPIMIVKKQGNDTTVNDTTETDTTVNDTTATDTIVNETTTNDMNHSNELISVDVSRDSDDETVDEFFNDMSKMMEKKGIMVNRSTNKYTLFDDAIPEE